MRSAAFWPRPWLTPHSSRCRGPAPRRRQCRGSSDLTAIVTSTNPASRSNSSVRSAEMAPATQPHSSAGSARRSSGSGAMLTTSEIASAAARLQHAERFAEHLRLVGHQIDHAVRDDHVGRVVGDRQVLELAEPEFHIGGADLGGILARLLEHLVRHVDADDAPRRRQPGAPPAGNRSRRRCRDRPRPRQPSSPQWPERIAAAKTEIGALRHGREFLVRIAHLPRLGIQIGCSSRSRSRTSSAGAQHEASARAAMPP